MLNYTTRSLSGKFDTKQIDYYLGSLLILRWLVKSIKVNTRQR